MLSDPRIADLRKLTDSEIQAFQPPMAAWSRDRAGRLQRIVFLFEGAAAVHAFAPRENAAGRRVVFNAGVLDWLQAETFVGRAVRKALAESRGGG